MQYSIRIRRRLRPPTGAGVVRAGGLMPPLPAPAGDAPAAPTTPATGAGTAPIVLRRAADDRE